jgi:tetratricopeptide (TPR) repeat protein
MRCDDPRAMDPRIKTILCAVLLCLLAWVGYRETFSVPFLFDDSRWIVDGQRIREDLWPPAAFFDGGTLRPILFYTLAINYHFGGLDVSGYHAVNLLIHAAAALVLFGLVRRTLRLAWIAHRFEGRVDLLAVAIAALWVAHPLATQAVTYTIQRGESLMSLLLLLCLYGLIRGANSARSFPWYLLSLGAVAFGMGCKEVMIVSPLVVLLFDRSFLASSFRQLMRQRGWYYVVLLLPWLWLATSALPAVTGAFAPADASSRAVSATASTTADAPLEELASAEDTARPPSGRVTPWEYARTQSGVLLHYLRLVVWPAPLCLDYDWPISSLAEAVLPMAVVAILVILSVVLFFRSPRTGFLPFCFFLLLIPTSSFLPISDVVLEHRMYLPLAVALAALVLAIDGVVPWVVDHTRWTSLQLHRTLVGVLVLALLGLTAGTFARNRDYQSRERLWLSVLDVYPDNIRALTNYAHAVRSAGRDEEAKAYFARAEQLAPDHPVTQGAIGALLIEEGRYPEALVYLRRAVALWPANGILHLNLGVVYEKLNEWGPAIDCYREAILRRPGMSAGHMNLGLAQIHTGEVELGRASLQRAVTLAPQSFEPLLELGVALAQQGSVSEALVYFQRASAVAPHRLEGHTNLFRAYADLGQDAEAKYHALRAIEIAHSQGEQATGNALQQQLQDWLQARDDP